MLIVALNSFDKFIELRVKITDEGNSDKNKQVDMICDTSGRILVDYVGKVENINSDFQNILNEIGLEQIKLPQLNTTKHNKYQSYYNEKTKSLIAKCFAQDIDLFEYKF